MQITAILFEVEDENGRARPVPICNPNPAPIRAGAPGWRCTGTQLAEKKNVFFFDVGILLEVPTEPTP